MPIAPIDAYLDTVFGGGTTMSSYYLTDDIVLLDYSTSTNTTAVISDAGFVDSTVNSYLIDLCSTGPGTAIANMSGQLYNAAWVPDTLAAASSTLAIAAFCTDNNATAETNCNLIADSLHTYWTTNNAVTNAITYSIPASQTIQQFLTDTTAAATLAPAGIKTLLSDVLNVPVAQINTAKTNTNFPALILRQILSGTMPISRLKNDGTTEIRSIKKTQVFVEALIDLGILTTAPGITPPNFGLVFSSVAGSSAVPDTVKVLLIKFNLSNPTTNLRDRFVYLMWRNNAFVTI
jgi:hypothetical protein